MGCSQSCNLESGDWTEDENSGKTEVGSSGSVLDDSAMKIICRKPRWDLGLGRRRSEKSEEENRGLENNRAWLLADSNVELKEGVLEYQEPQSIHSSFRFSFGSQVELDGLSFNNPNPSATVLLVNLEKGSENRAVEAGSIDLQWRRIQSLERSVSPVAESLIRFSYSEVQSATNHFSRGKVLGRGAHSCVFRGSLRFGRAVAIKQLDDKDKESAKNFCRELLIASSLENKNVVPLLGFCIDPQGLFLIYKFVSGGSLEHHLHDKKRSKSFLSWSVRYRVAIGIAQALAYLHNGTEKCVVHRDIKPSNVLLSSKKTAKLCDFGLATWTHGPSIPFLCKTVKGTFGYLAPEYFQHGKVSDKTDVYAFGVVLLELLTGRKPIETRKTQGEENLVLWAKPLLMHEGTELKLLDPRIRQVSYSSKQVSRMVRAAAACINSEESRRPNMEKVLSILRGEDQRSSLSEKLVLGLQDQETKSEMKSHLALAMLGVSDFEEDDPHRR